MTRKGASLEEVVGLDIAKRSLKASGALIQVAVDTNVTKFSALEAGLVIMEVITGKGCIMVAADPPDFCVSDGDFFFFGQRRQ